MAGYLGSVPVPQATQHRESFTCTEGQTSFATAGYTAQFVDVYLNGSHLSPADFTATNGSDVVLAVAASADDVCDIISYTPFEIANQTFTGTTTMTDVVAASLDISGDIDIDGTTNLDIVDIDGAVNMATTALVTGVLTTTAQAVFNGGFDGNAKATINTADGLSSDYALVITNGEATAGQNFGLRVRGGSNASDVAFTVETYDNGSDLFRMFGNGQASFHDGTASLPSITNIGDLNTGMFFPAADTVGFSTGGSERMRIDSSGNVGIGSTRTDRGLLNINHDNTGDAFNSSHIALTYDVSPTDNNSKAGITYATSDSDNYGYFQGAERTTSGQGAFVLRYHNNSASGTERMRMDSSGNLLVGHTSQDTPVDNGGAGVTLRPQGVMLIGGTGTAIFVNREDSDGTMMEFRKDGASLGNISVIGGNNLTIGGTVVNHCGLSFATNAILPVTEMAANNDIVDIGADGNRFDNIFATNGTINTSDQNEKQDIAGLTPTEMLVAKRLSALFKTFRWKSKVVSKGDDARTHTGTIAQDVQAAFSAEGLDAGNYSLFTSGSWWEHNVDVEAVEANENAGVKAADAYTRTDQYYIESEAPEGSTKKTTLGIRYHELLSFLAAYNEQRFAAIETRLTALEG